MRNIGRYVDDFPNAAVAGFPTVDLGSGSTFKYVDDLMAVGMEVPRRRPSGGNAGKRKGGS